MIFSRIGRSLSHSSLARNLLHGNGRLGTLVGGNVASSSNGGGGFLRGYIATNAFNSNFSDFKSTRLLRLFSTEATEEQNCDPKEKKEVPKGDHSKQESKDDSNTNTNTDEHGNFKEFLMELLDSVYLALLVAFIIFSYLLSLLEEYQSSFQEFKNKLLEPGLVDHIVVSDKSIAIVYVRSSPRNPADSELVQGPPHGQRTGDQLACYFYIGSVESFEQKLEETQKVLGIDPHDYVPVTYTTNLNFFLFKLTAILMSLGCGALLFMGLIMKGGFGFGGPARGLGGHGTFNKGTKLEQNAKKEKVAFFFFYK